MNISQSVSPTIEEYLEQIYRLEKEHGVARTKHLAKMVGVSLGTVTNTVKVLERKNLVTHEPYKGVKLTGAGLRIAINVIRRHRLAECLLTDFLKIDWSKVHEHSCRLEHAITNELSNSLEEALGHLKTCPHGNPIPDTYGQIIEEETQPLIDLDEGKKGIVVKIINEEQDLLEYLTTLNLVPGTQVEIEEKAPFEGPIILKLNEQKCPISRKIASIVWIKKEKSE